MSPACVLQSSDWRVHNLRSGSCCVYSVTSFQAIVTGWEIKENTEFGIAAIGRQQLAFCRQAWLSFRGLVAGHLQ